jgi:hypothetical protein
VRKSHFKGGRSAKGFRKLKAKSQLPVLRAALTAHRAKAMINGVVAQEKHAA